MPCLCGCNMNSLVCRLSFVQYIGHVIQESDESDDTRRKSEDIFRPESILYNRCNVPLYNFCLYNPQLNFDNTGRSQLHKKHFYVFLLCLLYKTGTNEHIFLPLSRQISRFFPEALHRLSIKFDIGGVHTKKIRGTIQFRMLYLQHESYVIRRSNSHLTFY